MLNNKGFSSVIIILTVVIIGVVLLVFLNLNSIVENPTINSKVPKRENIINEEAAAEETLEFTKIIDQEDFKLIDQNNLANTDNWTVFKETGSEITFKYPDGLFPYIRGINESYLEVEFYNSSEKVSEIVECMKNPPESTGFDPCFIGMPETSVLISDSNKKPSKPLEETVKMSGIGPGYVRTSYLGDDALIKVSDKSKQDDKVVMFYHIYADKSPTGRIEIRVRTTLTKSNADALVNSISLPIN